MSEAKAKQPVKKSSPKTKAEVEARRVLLGELFNDFNRSRTQVYQINFVRGLFFGFGSVLGGTILVALTVWLLTFLSRHLPFFSDLFRAISQVMQQS